jgi:hypothetical protein
MRTWKRRETVREKEWRRERIFFAKNKEIFCFQNLIGCIDSVCVCLLRSHAPSAPPPLISHHTAIICLACDHICPVWLNQTAKISFFAPLTCCLHPPDLIICTSYFLYLLLFYFFYCIYFKAFNLFQSIIIITKHKKNHTLTNCFQIWSFTFINSVLINSRVLWSLTSNEFSLYFQIWSFTFKLQSTLILKPY